MTMTDTQPIQSLIQTGDYFLRGDRLLFVVFASSPDLPLEQRVYETRQIKAWTVEGEAVTILDPASHGRRAILRETTRLRDRRYKHLPAASVVVREEPDPKPEPANETKPPILTGDDLIRAHVEALERNTRASRALEASIDLLRESIDRAGSKGKQLTHPVLAKAVGS